MKNIRKISTREQMPTFATCVLMCAVRNALRPFLRRPAGFKALLQMPPGFKNESMLYYLAVTGLFDPEDLYDDLGAPRLFVARLDEISIVGSLSKVFEAHRTILLCHDLGELDADIKLITDFEVVLDTPKASHFLAAARTMGMKDMTRADAEFLASLNFGKVKMAVNGHRTLRSAIGRLRRATVAEREKAVAETKNKKPEKTLRDMSGYGDAATWGLRLAEDLAAWKNGRIEWEDVDRGAVLYGMPGTGKTTYGRLLAATCGIPIIEASSARWQAEGHLGDMLKAMRKCFELARKKAPCVLFIDEFDAFGDRNSDTAGDNADYKRQVINGLLECLDPPGGREGVVVVAATNFPDVIDPALLRPGRLERLIGIPLPDGAARISILRQHLRGLAAPSDMPHFEQMSAGLGGADLALVAREVRRTVRREGRELLETDLLNALPPTRSLSEDELRRVAIHEAGHALVTLVANPNDLVAVAISRRVPLDDRGSSLGHVEIRRSQSVIATEESLTARIDIHLAGIAAERVVFGHHSTSGGGALTADLRLATELATSIERLFGFGEHLVLDMGTGPGALETLRSRDPDLWQAVDKRLKASLGRTEQTLQARKADLMKLADALMEKGRISGADMQKILQPGRGGATHEARAMDASRRDADAVDMKWEVKR
ncbi:AAA family ATPase [Neorhizobium sp. BT27B]|uniref:AAA family ATPase n=1 Tax=Neorhizobium sp. BT27B TaxID=3142625 RepID=UPI003D2E989A